MYSCTNVNAAVQSLCPIIIVRLLAILKGVRTWEVKLVELGVGRGGGRSQSLTPAQQNSCKSQHRGSGFSQGYGPMAKQVLDLVNQSHCSTRHGARSACAVTVSEGRVKVGARSWETWERKSGNCAELSRALLAPEPTCTDRVHWHHTSTSTGGPGEKGPSHFQSEYAQWKNYTSDRAGITRENRQHFRTSRPTSESSSKD